MAPPPFTRATGGTGSPEAEPRSQGRPTEQQPLRPTTPEELAAQEAARRQAVIRGTATGMSGVATAPAFEKLEGRAELRKFSQQTVELIHGIDAKKPPEAQRANLTALKDVSKFMLAAMLQQDPSMEKAVDLSIFDNVPLLGLRLSRIGANPAEVEAFKKLRELRDDATSPTTAALRAEWPGVVAEAKQTSQMIGALLTADLTQKYVEKDKGPGVIAEGLNWVVKNPKKSIAIAVAGAAGLYLAYHALSTQIDKLKKFFGFNKDEKKEDDKKEEGKEGGDKDKKEEDKKEKSSGWPKWLKWLGGAALAIGGLFGLGRVLGMDGVQEYFKKKLGWNIDASRVYQVAVLMGKGEIMEALKVAWEGADQKQELHKSIADMVSKEGKKVSAPTIFEVKDEKFEDYLSPVADIQDRGSKAASGKLGKWGNMIVGSKERAEERIAVREFLKAHDARLRQILPIRASLTVGEALNALYIDTHPTAAVAGAAPGAPSATVGGATGAALVAGALPPSAAASAEEKERDAARAKLSPEKQARAIQNENLLRQKITFKDIEQMRKDMDMREETLRALLTKPNLLPADKEKVEAKLATLAEQKEAFGRLHLEHNKAYLAYVEGMQMNADEQTLIALFTSLIEVKEHMEALHGEVFEREGWTVLEALAATHSLRFLTAAHIRWMKTGDIRADHANYLFDKLKTKLSPKGLAETYRRLRAKPVPRTLAELTASTDEILADIEKTAARWEKPTSGLANEDLGRKHLEELDEMEKRVAAQHKELQTLFDQKHRELKAALGRKDQKTAEGILEEIKQLGKHKVRLEFGEMSGFGKAFERWQQAFKGDPHNDVYKQGINKMRMLFRKALRNRVAADASRDAMSKMSRVVMKRGKFIFFAGNIVLGALGGELLHDDKTSRTKAYAQAGLGLVPLAGTYLDFYSAWNGEEQITKRKLDTSDRAISAVFGVVGLASDILTVVGGVGLLGKAGIVAVKAGTGFARGAKAAKVVRALEAARSAAEGGKVLRRVELLDKVRKVRNVGFAIGLGMALGQAAEMVFTQEAELGFSEDFKKQIIGDAGRELGDVASDLGLAQQPEAPSEGGAAADAGAAK